MVKDFNLSKEEDIGYYVGFLGSSFCFAQFLTASFWGYLSDRFGRRPIILMALLGNSLSLLMFGVSKSLAWAITARLACGLVNGTIGVAKSLLGEITDNTNRSRAFSLMSLNFGVGTVIGPALGGLLANPAEKYPDIFGHIDFLKEYPYFLPCFCSAIITWVGFTLGYFFLPETCTTVVGYQRVEDQIAAPSHLESSNEEEVDIDDNNEAVDQITEPQSTGLGTAAISSIFSYSILAFSDVYFAECFPLWAVTQPTIGLGFDGREIGIAFTVCGTIMLFNQLIIYPEVAKRTTTKQLYQISTIVLIIFPLMFPLISNYVAGNANLRWLLWPTLLLTMGLRTITNGFLFTSIFVLITVSAKGGQLGTVNGIAHAAASLTRTFAPTVGGISFAWSLQNGLPPPLNHLFIFTTLTIVSILLAIQTYFML
ncbi:hypothetical protein HDV04_002229 [Boothiomyces sp. JEL0838]|nr:hypothetical protein HDV04_002229 [Boothiomyces sp. JEL0838]